MYTNTWYMIINIQDTAFKYKGTIVFLSIF